jgi:hypothetical protein
VPVAAGVLGAVVIGPLAGALLAGAGIAAERWPRARRWLAWGPPTLYCLAAAYVLARQAVSKPTAAFEWPAEQATTHQVAYLAIALLALLVAVDPDRDRDRGREPDADPAPPPS